MYKSSVRINSSAKQSDFSHFSIQVRRTNIHEESWSGRPSVVSANLLNEIDENFPLLRNFTIFQLSERFSNISRTVLYETVTRTLGYWKFCALWVSQMLTEIHKTSRTDAALEKLGLCMLMRWQNLSLWHGIIPVLQNVAEENPSNFVSEKADSYRLLG
ncbi:uncharacterized protein TNCV_3773261 [Trichonephila clavipes]|nr:uncharacterized protein TNCV_3773261 [Trichonephila clavipes]